MFRIHRLLQFMLVWLAFTAAAGGADGAERPLWEPGRRDAPSLLVIIPGMDPAWWGANGDPHRDHYLRGLVETAGPVAPDSTWISFLEVLAVPVPLPPDTLWSRWRAQTELPAEGLILCGVDSAAAVAEEGLCLWISSGLREITDLSAGLPPGRVIRPARVRNEIRETGGILRRLRAEEAREILALTPSGLTAFQNLPAALPHHPMARLKRVFLGDKLFANAGLYSMAACRWRTGVIRFGLVQSYRQALLQIERAVDGGESQSREFLDAMLASGSLVADRIDRILFSLWNEIPPGGSLTLLLGGETAWVIERRKD